MCAELCSRVRQQLRMSHVLAIAVIQLATWTGVGDDHNLGSQEGKAMGKTLGRHLLRRPSPSPAGLHNPKIFLAHNYGTASIQNHQFCVPLVRAGQTACSTRSYYSAAGDGAADGVAVQPGEVPVEGFRER